MMASLTLFVGIHVAKDPLDVAVRPTAETWQGAKAAAEINTLVVQLEAMAPALVVREATGGFAGPLLAALAVAALPVVRANPRQVRACAQAVGILAKTGRTDARVLAHFAEAVTPMPRALPDAAPQELRAVLRHRRHVVDLLTAERHRLGTVPPRMHQAMQQHSAWLEAQLTSLDDAVTHTIQRSAGGQATAAVLQSLPRRGPRALADLAGAGTRVRHPGAQAESGLGGRGPLQLH